MAAQLLSGSMSLGQSINSGDPINLSAKARVGGGAKSAVLAAPRRSAQSQRGGFRRMETVSMAKKGKPSGIVDANG